MGKREIKSKELLDNLKGKISYWKLKEVVRGRPLWRTRCGRNYGTVVRECVKLLNVFLISDFRRVLNIVCILLGISPASDCSLPTFRNPLSVPSSRAGCRV